MPTRNGNTCSGLKTNRSSKWCENGGQMTQTYGKKLLS